MTLLDKVTIYVDAGFPILLIHSYEEKKIDEIIKNRQQVENSMSGTVLRALQIFLQKNHTI